MIQSLLVGVPHKQSGKTPGRKKKMEINMLTLTLCWMNGNLHCRQSFDKSIYQLLCNKTTIYREPSLM